MKWKSKSEEKRNNMETVERGKKKKNGLKNNFQTIKHPN